MSSRFSKLSSIDPSDGSTWVDRIFLTIDVDWASDRVLELTIDLLEAARVEATFFVTHPTDVLARLRANSRFELGIHPNFNPLLEGKPGPGDTASTVVERMLAIVPGAASARSHSMTQSSRLLDAFKSSGLTHESNHFVPAHAGIELKPFLHWNGLIRAPYCWEDDVALLYQRDSDVEAVLSRPGLKVFDFHPIHIALNSSSIEQYERSRGSHNDWAALQRHAAPGRGTRAGLENLIRRGT